MASEPAEKTEQEKIDAGNAKAQAKAEAKAKAAQAKADAKARAKQAKELLEQERTAALSDYTHLLDSVSVLKYMTDTQAWQEFYRSICQQIDQHAHDILDAEKTRDVIRHQEGVKILRGLMAELRSPVDNLTEFIREMPLFAPQMPTHATFNKALGRVELRTVEAPKG